MAKACLQQGVQSEYQNVGWLEYLRRMHICTENIQRLSKSIKSDVYNYDACIFLLNALSDQARPV